MQYEMWLKIICRHCLNLDKFCLFNMENWFLSTTPQELKGLDSQKAQEVHSDSRRNSCHSRALLPLQSLLGKLRYRLNRTEQEIRRNSESSSPFKEAALPSAWNTPHTHTTYFSEPTSSTFFLQFWVLSNRANPPNTCFQITVFFLFNLFTVNVYVGE